MKKLLLILALLLSLPVHAALVQSAITATNSGKTPVVTLTATQSGSAIIVIAISNASTYASVPTDNESNVYTVTGVDGTGLYTGSVIWYVCNATPGVTAVTLHGNTGSGVSAVVIEESGLAATSCYDQHASQMTTGPSWSSGNTGTLSQASEVGFGFVDNFSVSSLSATAGSGWTEVAQAVNTSVGPMVLFTERQVLSSTSAIAATGGSISGGSDDAGIATFKASGGGAACTSTAWVNGGTKAIPTASSTSVWLSTGAWGTTPCDGTGTSWWSTSAGNFVKQ